MNDMIERVARAIYEAEVASNFGLADVQSISGWQAWEEAGEINRAYRLKLARAALAAMREPTEAMETAFNKELDRVARWPRPNEIYNEPYGRGPFMKAYQAIIGAALADHPAAPGDGPRD